MLHTHAKSRLVMRKAATLTCLMLNQSSVWSLESCASAGSAFLDGGCLDALLETADVVLEAAEASVNGRDSEDGELHELFGALAVVLSC